VTRTQRDSQNWSTIERLFYEAIEQPIAQRAAFLAEACRDDPATRREVEALLAAAASTPETWDDSRRREDLDPTIEEDESQKWCGRLVGQFRIMRVIGSGGSGVVYEAEQSRPRRTVAVKLLRSRFASMSALRRFEYEPEVLARLRHPSIAQVFDAGVVDDESTPTPYYAMEFVPGAQTITDYVATHRPARSARLGLFLRASDAVQHGHQRGVVHRDLKPANILIATEEPEEQLATGSGEPGLPSPKIIDFGIAQVTSPDTAAAMRPDAVALAGTLAYMSPEQRRGAPDEIDVRSDVYALGVVLYELICGELPHPSNGQPIDRLVQTLAQAEPRPPSEIVGDIPPDLEAILLKAIAPDADERYQSVAELAGDIRAFMQHRPVSARPAGPLRGVGLYARRNRTLAAGVFLALLGLMGGSAAATVWAVQATRSAAVAERETRRAERINSFLHSIIASADPYASGGEVSVREMLDAAERRVRLELQDDPRTLASVLTAIGSAFTSIGRFEHADRILGEAYLLSIETSGEESVATAEALRALGWLRQRQLQLPQAESPLRRALAIQRRSLGNEHEKTIETLADLGLLLYEKCEFEEAHPVLREALGLHRRIHGDEHPGVARVLGVYAANTAFGLGDIDRGIKRMREAVGMSRRMLGRHPAVADELNNLAMMHKMRGEYGLAESLYHEAIEIQNETLDEHDPARARVLTNLAKVLQDRGEWSEAERYWRQALTVLGGATAERDAVSITMARCGLAESILHQDRPDEAIEMLHRIVAELEREIDPGHPLHDRARLILDEARAVQTGR
jgi:tetratricopeptide (TPR) repeat protein/tRNA A-37 threonylcarbamoyl transferase component Bud32